MTTPEKDATEVLVQCKICQKRYAKGSHEHCPEDYGDLVAVGEDPLIGTYLDKKYEIISFVGEGGMSIVYKAKHRYMDRFVAVKFLREAERDPGDRLLSRKRFEEEAKAASAITHQNIVTVYDFGFTNKGQPYLVMDFLDGETLSDILERDRRISVERAVPIFVQICDGLDPMHQIGLVHRDLKPSNVVVTKQPQGGDLAKIVDFGIALFLPREGRENRFRLTQTGEVFGSANYMSPEQCQGKPLDARSDIYSMGCLMYEALSGQPVFTGDSFGSLVIQHSTAAPASLNSFGSDVKVPKAVEDIVFKCLAKTPEDRYLTVAELRQALVESTTGPHTVITTPNAVQPTSAKTKPSKSPLIAVGIGVFVLTAGLGFAALWKGPERDRGTIINKLRWNFDLSLAQQAVQDKNYPRAIELLKEAKTLTADFTDRSTKLLTLQRLTDAYAKAGDHKSLRATQKLVERELETETLIEFEDLLVELNQLAAKKQTLNDEKSNAVAARVLSTASKLQTIRLYREEETLLWKAIETYQNLKVTPKDDIADFDMAMAECLLLQQRWPEIRWYLVDGLQIRSAAVTYNSNSETIADQIRSYLKIGQHDRDQSNFKEAKVELLKALELTEKHLPNDTQLLAECINSYADLMRQMGNMAEYKKLIARSDAIWYQQERQQGQPIEKEPAKEPDWYKHDSDPGKEPATAPNSNR